MDYQDHIEFLAMVTLAIYGWEYNFTATYIAVGIASTTFLDMYFRAFEARRERLGHGESDTDD